MHTQSNTVLGITFNVIASLLFALMFAYTTLLHSLQGNEIYGWRILLTLPCLTLFIIVQEIGRKSSLFTNAYTTNATSF